MWDLRFFSNLWFFFNLIFFWDMSLHFFFDNFCEIWVFFLNLRFFLRSEIFLRYEIFLDLRWSNMLMFIQVTSQFYHFNFFGVPPIIFIGSLKKNIEPQKNRSFTFSGVPQPSATSFNYFIPALLFFSILNICSCFSSLQASVPRGPAAHSKQFWLSLCNMVKSKKSLLYKIRKHNNQNFIAK